MKLVTIVGARPQFIKAAVLSRKLQAATDFDEVIIHTGQHYDKEMSGNFFEELKIPAPAYNLGINNLTPARMTGQMIEALEPVLVNEIPDMVIVYGDTNSTLAGALTAKKLQIPIAHIEAGLRSGDMDMPEEVNRVITDRISDLLFCPTVVAVENLHQEAFEKQSIYHVGDIMLDAALMFAPESKAPATDIRKPYALCTFHRQQLVESKKRLQRLLKEIILLNEKLPVLLVAHPRTKQVIAALHLRLPFMVIEPLSYLEMIHVIKESSCIITDSGGLQKEAYFFRKPCITIRENTEWKELLGAGVNKLAGDDGRNILSAYHELTSMQLDFSLKYYGDGNAAALIIDIIRKFLNERQPL
jgi:UDP-GlcNAc3NAcA epimerase